MRSCGQNVGGVLLFPRKVAGHFGDRPKRRNNKGLRRQKCPATFSGSARTLWQGVWEPFRNQSRQEAGRGAVQPGMKWKGFGIKELRQAAVSFRFLSLVFKRRDWFSTGVPGLNRNQIVSHGMYGEIK